MTGQLLRQLVEKAACTHFVQVEEHNVYAAVAAAEAVLAEHVDQARVIEVDETAQAVAGRMLGIESDQPGGGLDAGFFFLPETNHFGGLESACADEGFGGGGIPGQHHMAVSGQSRQLRLVGWFNCDRGFAGALGIALQHIAAAFARAQHQSVVAFAGGAELGVLFVEDFFDNFQQSPQQNQGD